MGFHPMSDRVLRDEIWESERFLDLPTDQARLSFIRFLNLADDFGNFEGGPRRLFRMLSACTTIKTEKAASDCIDALMQADLIRRYEVDGRELFHVPRMRPHRQYLVRKMPSSPWDPDRQLGKTQRIQERGLAFGDSQLKEGVLAKTATGKNFQIDHKDECVEQNQEVTKNLVTTSIPRSNHVAQGVGVGVGVGVNKEANASSENFAEKPANFPPDAPTVESELAKKPAELQKLNGNVPYQKIVDLYHEALPMLPKVWKLTEARKAALRARWRGGDMDTIEDWATYFRIVAKSKFLTGRVEPPPGRKRFEATLEWLIKDGNFTKIMEHKYHDG